LLLQAYGTHARSRMHEEDRMNNLNSILVAFRVSSTIGWRILFLVDKG